MTTGLIIGLLILITSIGLYACKGKIQGKEKVNQEDNVTKTKVKDNPYPGLRNQAINVTPEQLQLQLDNDNDIYGLVMDWNMGDAIVTVISFKTGDASVYLSTGQAFIGGYAHETVINAAKQFVAEGEKYLSKATKTDNTEPTNENKVDFYFLTKSGKYYIEDDFGKIENETSELYGLFESANQVITEYRLITDKK
ncbi:MAG: hypothetical protein PHR79_07325 [Bacteroidales bacterium]|nr:hypothetical protein [Bacteroidales bacterium]